MVSCRLVGTFNPLLVFFVANCKWFVQASPVKGNLQNSASPVGSTIAAAAYRDTAFCGIATTW